MVHRLPEVETEKLLTYEKIEASRTLQNISCAKAAAVVSDIHLEDGMCIVFR